MRPKDIGTRFETVVVNYLRIHGFPHAERRALAGVLDRGDITGTPGIAWECKAGAAAHTASDLVVTTWLADTERERRAANADVGVLVIARRGVGALRAGCVWAIVRADALGLNSLGGAPVRMSLEACVRWLRDAGYGDPNEPTDPTDDTGRTAA